jgi:hypothetical protein
MFNNHGRNTIIIRMSFESQTTEQRDDFTPFSAYPRGRVKNPKRIVVGIPDYL